jgi:hypothetical protein
VVYDHRRSPLMPRLSGLLKGRCVSPPATGVLPRLTLAGPPPLPSLLTKRPPSAALLGLDLDPGLSAKGDENLRVHGRWGF